MNTTPSSTPHFTSTTASDDTAERTFTLGGISGERALVLGGGGSAGNAWLIGVIAGLFDAGLDVTEADLIIGTSAGSTAAAQITSATPTELLAGILAAGSQQRTGPVGSEGGRVPIGPAADHMERTSGIIAAAEDAADMRRRMGAAALEMDAASDGSGQTRWRATVAARLPSQRWPERTVLIVAVDAHTGEPVVFDRHSGVDLVERRRRQHFQWLRCPSLQHRRQPIHRRRLPIQRECRSGSRIRAGAGAVTTWRQITDTAGVGHASCSAGRRTPRPRQQSRNHLPGQRLPQRIRQQSDGSVDASARRSSRLQPRQSPCRAAHRILALTPTNQPARQA